MSEPKILMLSPLDVLVVAPGSVQIDADCGHRAWISPSGMTMLLGGGVTTRCQDCTDAGDITGFEIVPGSREELNAVLGVDHTDQLIAEVLADPAYVVRGLQADMKRQRRRRR